MWFGKLQEKRQQLLNEIRTLCEAPRVRGLVEFYGAFYSPDSGQISIALEYMDGGSLADIVRTKKFIPEPILSVITRKVLKGLVFLHGERHLVHRDIKPANLLINLNGEPKITDFGISAGLDNSIAMCATFVGTVTYMSPERINNQCYSYPADIWSLGLSLLECGTGEFPYNASKGPVNLMLQVMYDPSPSPPSDRFSSEFRSFVDACLLKEADARPTAEQVNI
jgi:serine/threonine protein kinase